MKTISKKNVIDDIKGTLKSWRIWYSLAMQDILLRYRGSVLGPFWITISTAITVYSMGYLYGILFGMNPRIYLPHFATGIITWNFISMIVNESTKIILESKQYMQNIQLPCIIYIFRLIFRNIVIFAHNLLVYISIVLVFQLNIGINTLNLIPGLLILSLNGIFYGTIIAFISTRFPDFGSIVTNILQVFFFITPIMWMPSALPDYLHFFLTFNPFLYFVNLLRNPLLGIGFTIHEMFATLFLTLLGMILFLATIRAYRSRIIFWL